MFWTRDGINNGIVLKIEQVLSKVVELFYMTDDPKPVQLIGNAQTVPHKISTTGAGKISRNIEGRKPGEDIPGWWKW